MTNSKNLSATWPTTGAPTRRVEKHIRENIGESHSRQIDTSDQEDNVDPNKFNEAQLYGITRRRVFIEINNAEISVPEIVGHIIKNWNNKNWLKCLIFRYDMNTDLPSEENEKSIWSNGNHFYFDNIETLRYLLLSLSGVKRDLIASITKTTVNVKAATFPESYYLSKYALNKINLSNRKRK
jgi:hypothetical protein